MVRETGGQITNINKEVKNYETTFEGLDFGPSASNSVCGPTAKKARANRLRFAIASPSREYDPENMLFACNMAIASSEILDT